MTVVSNFPGFIGWKIALLIMMEILDFEDQEVIATDYGFRIKLDLYGNYSKYPLNH
jgi:hypothetical protein